MAIAHPMGGGAGAKLPGPCIRADVVDVYIARPAKQAAHADDGETARSGPGLTEIDLLQLQRTKAPLLGTWQPVMGHIEHGETAVQAAIREMQEEVGLTTSHPMFDGLWALEQVHPFYISQIDSFVLSPRFVVLVMRTWEPTLNSEHGAARWVNRRGAEAHFMWPGQYASIAELAALLDPGHPAHTHQRLT